jgi:hypothetical protein
MNTRPQGGADVRRYGHTPDGHALSPMKTLKPRLPGRFARTVARPANGIAAISPVTASRTIRVEPLVRHAPRRG